ncbi:MAG: hypothetical protein K0R05_2547 [Anaerocolumna sp.]|jgi:hypothetical protein|nr:hypothetical protein [Anaerocolumna sp.]
MKKTTRNQSTNKVGVGGTIGSVVVNNSIGGTIGSVKTKK